MFFDLLLIKFYIENLIIFLIIIFLFIIIIVYLNETKINNDLDIENIDTLDDTDDIDDTDNTDDKDIILLNTIDDTKDPNLRNFKLRLIEVKRSFGNYWNNYYNWHYKYNGNFNIFNWYRFNKWFWKKKDYDALKNKSDSDFLKLKISWLRFQEAYLKISRNSSYHDLVTKIYLRHYNLLQLIKESIKKNFSKK